MKLSNCYVDLIKLSNDYGFKYWIAFQRKYDLIDVDGDELRKVGFDLKQSRTISVILADLKNNVLNEEEKIFLLKC